MRRSEIRIATVYKRTPVGRADFQAMDTIRWLRVSEGLADLGFSVDIIADTRDELAAPRPNLRVVPYARVDWSDYHVVKTLFHSGFRALAAAGGEGHPFIVSKLGSVVGARDDTPGVHFFGRERQALWELQPAIHRRARYVTILTEASRGLWRAEVGGEARILLVPTGVDREIPPPSRNPYPPSGGKVAVYLGNIYSVTQPEINRLWQDRLNALGQRLRRRGIRLYFVGRGRTDRLDPRMVTCPGPVAYEEVWDYQYFASVGIALAQGPVQDNESSKIYYYLRTGLPVVSEAPIPNNHLVEESGCGFIAPYDDEATLAEMIEAAAVKPWDHEQAVQYILANHTWDRRMRIYEQVLAAEFGV